MSSTRWTTAESRAIGDAGEIIVSSMRPDGSLRPGRIVWVVRHGEELYVRSVNGPAAAWFRGVQTRHQGRIEAGALSRDVMFVEAGHTVGSSESNPASDPEYEALQSALDAAYGAKYGHTSAAVQHITSEQARQTTLRLDPLPADPGMTST